LLEGEL